MRIIMLGPPGAGKGTQAVKIAEKLNIPPISTGEIFRKAINEETPLGKKAKEYMDKGLLVPDEIVVGIVKERLKQPDCLRGFVLDGFPRTVPQAVSLDEFLEGQGLRLDAVLNITVPGDELIERFTGRRVCSSCGATYHVKYSPPGTPGICDKCGGKLITRHDDKIDTVRNRLRVYESETAPLIDYYRRVKLLIDIDGARPIDAVFQDIMNRLRGEEP